MFSRHANGSKDLLTEATHVQYYLVLYTKTCRIKGKYKYELELVKGVLICAPLFELNYKITIRQIIIGF